MHEQSRRFVRFFASPWVIICLGLILFALLLLNSAWLHEDAFITLRTVDNFINGHGLRYNVIERVQTYTHPLWMFVLVLPHAISKEPIYSTIFVSVITSVLALFLLLRFLAYTVTAKIVAILILISSRPYIDYGTSGLENPMSHLVMVSFYAIYFTQVASFRSLFFLTLLASLAGVNRLDTILFYIPPLIATFFQLASRRALIAVCLGALPLIAWTVFSFMYYGFLLPNSAYAKLNTHIASLDLFVQGTYYYKDLLIRDPLTFSTITVGLFSTFFERNRVKLAVAAGLILYLLYILRIGGDYMSGRFFTVPLLSATVLIIRSDWLNALSRRSSLIFLLIIIVLGFMSANPVLLPFESERSTREERGITDERAFYESFTGLLPNLMGNATAEEHWLSGDGIRAREGGESTLIKGGIGLAGYFAGPQVHVVDTLALADVFLARLPVGNPKYWRIGHFKRVRPAGFDESIQSGNNEITDPNLALFFDKLQTITRDPLLDNQRLVAIWKVNTGQYSSLLDADEYISQQMLPLERDPLCEQITDPPLTKDQCVREVPVQGFSIDFNRKQMATGVELILDANYDYELIFLDGEMEIGRISTKAPSAVGADELVVRKIAVPAEISLNGFDSLKIRPMFIGLDPKNPRAVGQISLTNDSE